MAHQRLSGSDHVATVGPLVVDEVSKVYPGGLRANDGISLRVEPGEVFGLLGPNGAGKTTLVSQIIGLLRPTGGAIRLGEHDLVADPSAARQLCAYLPQAQLPIESMRAREAIDVIGRLRGADTAAVRRRREELLARLRIEDWRDRLGSQLSGGVKRLVGFALTAVAPRPLVILDEPTNDVDPLRRRLLWSEVRDLAGHGVAVLLVTHNVLEAERTVDRLAIVDHGRVLVQGTPSALKAADRARLRFELILEPGADEPELPGFVARGARVRQRLLTTIAEPDAPAAIDWVRRETERGAVEEYEIGATSLEDLYVRLVREGANGAEADDDVDVSGA